MKKLLLCLMMLQAIACYSQIQKGIVKTISRPDIPSITLSDVIIQPKGPYNKVITDDLGCFKMVLSDKKEGDSIALINVYKKGYDLRDKEVIGRYYGLSYTVPIIIQMIDLQQYEIDKQRIETKAYQSIEENYQKRIKELEAQKRKDSLSVEQCKTEYELLQKEYEGLQSKIESISDYYARADYDQLDSLDVRIISLIENADFDTAYALIMTKIDPETVAEHNHAIKQNIEERLRLAQAQIDRIKIEREYIKADLNRAETIIEMLDDLAIEYDKIGDVEKALKCRYMANEIKEWTKE